MSLRTHYSPAVYGDTDSDGGLLELPERASVGMQTWLTEWGGGTFAAIAPFVKLPSYFGLMMLVERHHPEHEWQVRKALMEQCLAEYCHAVGFTLLTPLSRKWYGAPRTFQASLCGGTLSFGRTYFREPVSFFEKLNPSGIKHDPPWE